MKYSKVLILSPEKNHLPDFEHNMNFIKNPKQQILPNNYHESPIIRYNLRKF